MRPAIALLLVWGFTLPLWLHIIVWFVVWIAIVYIAFSFQQKADAQYWATFNLYFADYDSVIEAHYDGKITDEQWNRSYKLVLRSEQLFDQRG